MIRELNIQNFKAWADSGKVRMAPLTIFCGTNSSGKSSIAQFLLMLKQTVESFDRLRVIHPGDSSTLVDLGTYTDIIHDHNLENHLRFAFEFDSDSIRITDAHQNKTIGTYDKIHFEAELSHDQKVRLDWLKYRLLNGNELDFKLSLNQGKYKLESENYTIRKQAGRQWPLPQPENFFGFPDEAIAYYQNTGFLQDLSLAMKNFFKNVYYLGPLRDHPERLYQFSGDTPPHVGEKGTLSINAVLASVNRSISRGYMKRAEPFETLIARWLKSMGLIHSFSIKQIGTGRKEYEVRVRVKRHSPEVLITDVGFGVSQILPVIVQCFYVPANSILFFEQPEIHLHPSVQSHLGDLFIEAIHSREKGSDRNIQVVVESHSEHLIRRIQRRVAEEKLKPKEVAIYFVDQLGGKARLRELEMDMFGNITNWPENFFGDDLEDLSKMTEAAMDRRKSNMNA